MPYFLPNPEGRQTPNIGGGVSYRDHQTNERKSTILSYFDLQTTERNWMVEFSNCDNHINDCESIIFIVNRRLKIIYFCGHTL